MIVLFDGVCNLCNGFVQFIIRQDPEGLVRFASLQSEQGQALLKQHGLSTEAMNTVVLIKDGEVFIRSAAVLTLMPALSWKWQWLRLGWLLPQSWRDALYDWVAARRYKWFGQREECMLPTADTKGRFL
ncbi:MAG: thiol-disulfide oxidoreductase DCC family protein [Bacteroidetes bacterium]|nr:MAG: thiol-disulfide oxidoreductase DCC family protein [Bacteroidota bacterium]